MTQETFLVLSASRNPDSHSDPIGGKPEKGDANGTEPKKEGEGGGVKRDF
jgi:hypothetical protein